MCARRNPSCARRAGRPTFCAWKRGRCSAWCSTAHVLCVNRKRIKIIYSGSVQGVGFRYTVLQVATGFEVTGTVRNMPDGRVELIAEGAQDELEAFRQGILESALRHFIHKEEAIWSEAANGLRGFEIVR